MFEIHIGDFVLRPPYGGNPGNIAIHRADGEGGDFPIAELSEAIRAYYEANF